MNKLKKILVDNKSWGNEITWGNTDSYITKTIEINPHSETSLMFYENTEFNFIVIHGDLFFTYGSVDEIKQLKTYKLVVGWSWFIEAGKIFKFSAMQKPARLILVSSSVIDEVVRVQQDEESVDKFLKSIGFKEKPKRGRPKGSKTKKKVGK